MNIEIEQIQFEYFNSKIECKFIFTGYILFAYNWLFNDRI